MLNRRTREYSGHGFTVHANFLTGQILPVKPIPLPRKHKIPTTGPLMSSLEPDSPCVVYASLSLVETLLQIGIFISQSLYSDLYHMVRNSVSRSIRFLFDLCSIGRGRMFVSISKRALPD